MEQEQNLQPPTESAPEEAGSLDAAALAFEKREQAPQEPAAEAEAEAEDAELTTEADEADPEPDTEPAEDYAEVEYEGLKVQVPKDAAEVLQKALLRQSDYSRKMNEVAAKEKTYTQRAELADSLIEGAKEYAQVMAEMQVIDARLKQFDGLNWGELRQQNPAEYAALAADAQGLRWAKGQAEAKAGTIQTTIDEKRQRSLGDKRAEMFKALETGIKGWSDDMGEQITKYATSNGVSFETLSKLTDPGVVIALEKARKFDELQSKRANLKPNKDVPPVLKPGAPRKADPKADALTRLRKSNSLEDATAAFLAKLR